MYFRVAQIVLERATSKLTSDNEAKRSRMLFSASHSRATTRALTDKAKHGMTVPADGPKRLRVKVDHASTSTTSIQEKGPVEEGIHDIYGEARRAGWIKLRREKQKKMEKD